MTIFIHVLIAISSIVYAGYIVYSPTKKGLFISYSLVAATLFSGIYLVVSTRSALLSACITGLVYLGVVMSGIFAAHYRLHTRQKVSQ